TRSKRDWSSDVCSSDLAQRDGGAPPQLADLVVPDDLAGVVVTVQAQGTAEVRLVFRVDTVAAQVDAVRADHRLPPRPARKRAPQIGRASCREGGRAAVG